MSLGTVISFSFGFQRGKPDAFPATQLYLKMRRLTPSFLCNIMAESLQRHGQFGRRGLLRQKQGVLEAPPAHFRMALGIGVQEAVYRRRADKVS